MSKQKGRKPAEVIITDSDREFLEPLIRKSTAAQAQVLNSPFAIVCLHS